jgi:hypothetical protein
MPMDRIFVSYRRADAEAEAAHIAERLRAQFGEEEVFFDTRAIESGVRWRDRIDAALEAAQVMVVIIGRQWLDVANDQGTRRLDAPGDIVVHEISHALARGIPVIPVRIQGAPVPPAARLPEALRSLFDFTDGEVRAGAAFDRDMQALIGAIDGRRRGWRRWLVRRRAAATASLAALAVGGAAWNMLQPPLKTAAGDDVPAPVEAMAPPQSLVLQVKLAGASPAPQAMKLWHRSPSRDTTPNISLLEQPQNVSGATFEYRSPLPLMPPQHTQYLGVMHRFVASGTLDLEPTEVCFLGTARPKRNEPLVRLNCVEGGRCKVSDQDVGWAADCPAEPRTAAAGVGWSLWPQAHAAGTSERTWAVPSLQTLRAAAGRTAFSEVRIASGPLPTAAGADRVVWSVRINDSPLRVDGLPAAATPSVFDAARGLDLRFGLENLDASGRFAGQEDLLVSFEFMAGTRTVLSDTVRLKYVALRPIPETDARSAAGVALRWSAEYHPGAADAYQVFLESPSTGDGLPDRKRRIDATGLAVEVEGRSLPLVAVQRPPFAGNRNHGLNAGLKLPSGQVKFSFDDATSRQVCRALIRLAPAYPGLLRTDTYRRTLDGNRRVNACASFSGG